jgi:multisubunit Na+/H+ antiporter MnhG subunit
MEDVGKALLLVAGVLGIIGGVLLLVGKLGLHRLPGDIVIRRGGLTIYIPFGLMILLSLVGSLVLGLLSRR